MNYAERGAAALAEMSPYGRPYASIGSSSQNPLQSGWARPSYPLVAGYDSDEKNSGWQPATYALEGKPHIDIGADAATFLSENKIACALAAAVIAGGAAYYYGYR